MYRALNNDYRTMSAFCVNKMRYISHLNGRILGHFVNILQRQQHYEAIWWHLSNPRVEPIRLNRMH